MGLDRNILSAIFGSFGFVPTINAFASKESTFCSIFFSKIPQLGSSGTHFLSQTLSSSERYFFCWLVSAIIDTLYHVELSKTSVSAPFIVPKWKSALFWPLLHNGKSFENQ